MKRLVLITMILFASNTAFAIQDTPEQRNKEADRYLAVTPPREMFQDVAEQMALNLPPDQREQFRNIMTKYLDIEAVTKSMKESMVKLFTADELAALADFYGSPIGVSATKKMGAYMGELMPTIQAEALKAVAKANREMKDPEEGTADPAQ
ncbi:MAG: hypothetical protein CXR31_14150 [Geobacter sp.]|nr:MAG: hypothetical protein CXR31_14150 [Geobacter sp.]